MSKVIITGFRSLTNGRKVSRNDIMNGADPEFAIIDKGTVRSACALGLRCGADQVLGADGAGTPCEIRIAPSKPLGTIPTIKKILRQFTKRFPGMKLDASSDRIATGCHIHVSAKNIYITEEFARSVAAVANVFLGEPAYALNGRARLNSGYASHRPQYRLQEYVLARGMEYRNPCSSIMYDPKLFAYASKIVRMIFWNHLAKARFSYNSVPTDADFHKVCHMPAAEVAEYKALLANYDSLHAHDLLAAWGVKMKPAPVREQVIAPAAARRAAVHPNDSDFGHDGFSPRRRSAVPSAAQQREPFTIHFNDDWNPIIRAAVEARLRQRFSSTAAPVTLNLFGLNVSRGRVATIIIPSFEICEHSAAGWSTSSRRFSVGLPFIFRMGEHENLNEINLVADRILSDMNTHAAPPAVQERV